MGVSDVEARFLSRQAGAEKVSGPLRHSTEYRRSQFHLPPTGERNDHSELAAETPPHFRFGIKAHQVITHIKRLKGAEDFVPRFLATIEPLAAAGKLGPVLFQLPPNLKADGALLKDFLALLPRTMPAAFEFRHESWFSDETWDLLKSSDVALCVAETETLTTPDVSTGKFVYYRFRKPSYTGEERQSMIDRIQQHLAAGRDVFAYFKHEETPEGALYAVDLLGEVSGAEPA